MRATVSRLALLVLGTFAGCGGENENARVNASAGNGAQSGSAGASGTVGSSGTAGSSAGGSGTSGTSGAPAMGGDSGAPGISGGAGAAGAGSNEGGTAGESSVAGGSGTASGAAGAESAAGTAGQGTSGASGAAGAGGIAGAGGVNGTSGAAGLSSGGSTAGTSGGSGMGGAAGAAGQLNEPVGLSFPIDCVPNQTCVRIGYPDIDGDGDAHDCGDPGYVGHEGTDIDITFEALAAGTAVFAAADGVVVFAFDGKYDQCPDDDEPDCQPPQTTEPGSSSGTTVCTPVGPYCGTGEEGCAWCFAGGNVIVVRHQGVPGVFATRYDHLKKDSVLVEPGDTVTRGEKIAEAASSGSSTAPHLHFEVWGTGFYELADPWAGACGPNTGPSLWAYDPPWSG